jgi:hypothetical protein
MVADLFSAPKPRIRMVSGSIDRDGLHEQGRAAAPVNFVLANLRPGL